ncbi:hypothetical protein AA11237_0874 [Acidocella aminolytica 101 = DSM 11237]|nr:hypothetical protein AA11237_0874 [Acidocella aminolytica 101 = DSM 11237]
MKVLVGVLGVLIIVGTTVVVGTVIHRLYASFNAPPTPPHEAAAPAPGAVPPALPPASVAAAKLAPGEHISGIASAGGDVAIWVSGPTGDRLLLLNPATGQTRVALASP